MSSTEKTLTDPACYSWPPMAVATVVVTAAAVDAATVVRLVAAPTDVDMAAVQFIEAAAAAAVLSTGRAEAAAVAAAAAVFGSDPSESVSR